MSNRFRSPENGAVSVNATVGQQLSSQGIGGVISRSQAILGSQRGRMIAIKTALYTARPSCIWIAVKQVHRKSR